MGVLKNSLVKSRTLSLCKSTFWLVPQASQRRDTTEAGSPQVRNCYHFFRFRASFRSFSRCFVPLFAEGQLFTETAVRAGVGRFARCPAVQSRPSRTPAPSASAFLASFLCSPFALMPFLPNLQLRHRSVRAGVGRFVRHAAVWARPSGGPRRLGPAAPDSVQ